MLWFIVAACSPSAPQIALGPTPANTTDELVVTPGPGQGEMFEYRWSVDGTVQTDIVGNRVPPSRTARDQKWTVAVSRVRNAKRSDEVRRSLTIVNAPPLVEAIIVQGRDGLEAVLWPSDPDGDPVTTSWVWSVGGVEAQSGGSIPYASLVSDQVITLTATVSDGELTTTTDQTFLPGNQPPTLRSAVVMPSSPGFADTLSLEIDATDPEADPLTVHALWRVDGVVVHEGATLPPGIATVNDSIDAVVTMSDGSLESETVTTPVTRMVNTAPSITDVRVEPPQLAAGTAPRCEVDGWSDPEGEPETLRIRWFINGILYSESASPSASALSKGDGVACEATAIDSESEGNTLLSEEVMVVNTPPSVARVVVEPEEPMAGDVLIAHVETPYDPDGDPIVVDLRWQINGVDAGTGLLGEGALPADAELNVALRRGDEIDVRATPFDLQDEGIPVTTLVIIGNTPPEITSVVLSPDPPIDGLDIQASVSMQDVDGDVPTATVRWKVNGGPTITGPILDAAAFQAGDEISLEVRAFDGTDESDPTLLDGIIVQ